MSFADLGLSSEVVQAVTDAGYVTPTPIQEQAIPVVLAGRDVLGCAQTGTGKTASFTLPMISLLSNGRSRARMPRSLILEPTRELAAQVAENFEKYGKHNKLSMALLIGGVSYGDQEKLLDRGVDVLIATPGRLLDHFERGRILLTDVKVFVIDEADRMLDMGFIPDVEKIVSILPARRQTLFFSATMPPEIRRLADAFLSDPKEITVAPPASPAKLVEQYLAIIDERDKRDALRHLLRSEEVRNAIIFCNRKKDVSILHRSLNKHGFAALQLHGDMQQSARTETLERFKAGDVPLLIASDVAARGIDIADLSHVFNFDIPIHAEDYVHRIGRTGRAGKSGRAFSLASPDDFRFVSAIEKMLNQEIPRYTVEGVDEAAFDPDEMAGKKRRRKPGVENAGRDNAGRERRPAPKPARPPREAAVVMDIGEPQPVAVLPMARPDAPVAERRRFERDDRRDDRRGDDRRRREYRRPMEDDEPVIGLGDHIPAFLLRPVPLPKSA